MIARVWRGWTTSGDGDAYEGLLRVEVFPGLSAGVAGFRGGYVLRRDRDGEAEFLVVTLFESLEAVRAFAGRDYEVPVIEPEARRLLVRGDERAAHYETVLAGK
jgi:heme-degrading monooxygenase HmoA